MMTSYHRSERPVSSSTTPASTTVAATLESVRQITALSASSRMLIASMVAVLTRDDPRSWIVAFPNHMRGCRGMVGAISQVSATDATSE